MEELDDILGFIADVQEAYENFCLFYRVEPVNEEDVFLRFGCDLDIRDEFGRRLTLNRTCEHLIYHYKNIMADSYGIAFMDKLNTLLVNAMSKCDEATRLFQIRKIISKSVELLGMNTDLQLDVKYTFDLLERIDEYGILIYHDNKTNEEVKVYGDNDTLDVFLAIRVASWLSNVFMKFYRAFIEQCTFWGVNIEYEISKQVKEIGELGVLLLGKTDERNVSESLHEQVNNQQQKKDCATAKMKCEIFTTLLKALGYTPPSNVEFSKFISWLCGGSPESIRQNGFIGTLKDADMGIIKERLKLIGIDYESGKIIKHSTKK